MLKAYLQDMVETLRKRVSDLQDQIDALEKKRLVTEAQLQAYQDTLNRAPSDPEPKRIRNRKLSKQWADILTWIYENRLNTSSLDKIEEAARGLGYKIERGTLRSRMVTYVDRGLVEWVPGGSYRVTETGRVEAGKAHVDTAKPETEAGGATTPPAKDEMIPGPLRSPRRSSTG